MSTTETFDIVGHAKQLQRKQLFRRYATIGTGLSLLVLGLSTRIPLRALIAALGAGLTVRGLTEHALRDNLKRLRKGMNERKRRHRRPGERELDQVDEASWESFPASDPPSFAPR